MDNTYWVYILSSGPHGTLYVGVTNSLERRIAEHKAKEIKGFTATYDVCRLVYFRAFGEVSEAIHYEKQLKRWRRAWKIRLIEETNPHWADLYREMMALPPLHPDLAAALGDNSARHTTPECHPGFATGEDRDPLNAALQGQVQRQQACAQLNGSRSLATPKPG